MMANRERGEVSFEADGKTWTLSFGTNAICGLEAEMDKPAGAIFASLDGSVDFRTFRSVFRAGLARHHKGLKLDEAGDLIDEVGLSEAARLVGESVKASMPDAKPGEAVAEA